MRETLGTCRPLRYPAQRRPCATCPFRKPEHRDGEPFYYGDSDRAVAASAYLEVTGVEWPCHQDVELGMATRENGSGMVSMFESRDMRKPPRACAGLVAVAESSGTPTPGLQRAKQEGRYTPGEAGGQGLCYASLDEFREAEGVVDTGDIGQRVRWLGIQDTARKMRDE